MDEHISMGAADDIVRMRLAEQAADRSTCADWLEDLAGLATIDTESIAEQLTGER